MNRKTVTTIGWGNLVLVAALSAAWPVHAQDTKAPAANAPAANAPAAKATYPSMAPIEQYRMDRDAEIALARTAAPASISRDADILVLGQKNYETAVKGKNGFVCLVGRSWTGPLDNPEFWNPKNRSPMCYDPPAARSVLAFPLKVTGMALAGLSRPQMADAIKTAVDTKELGAPEPGSMVYMMSKEAYLTDRGSHNLSHLMFEMPHMDGATWGADAAGTTGRYADSPVFYVQFDPVPMTEFYVSQDAWSDGTPVRPAGPAVAATHSH